MVGIALGSKSVDAVHLVIQAVLLTQFLLAAALSLGIFIFRFPFYSFMTTDMQVILLANSVALIVAIYDLIYYFHVGFGCIFKGIGEMKIPFIVSFLCSFLIGVSLAIILTLYTHFRLAGFYIAMILANSLEILILGLVLYQMNWSELIECLSEKRKLLETPKREPIPVCNSGIQQKDSLQNEEFSKFSFLIKIIREHLILLLVIILALTLSISLRILSRIIYQT